MKKQKPKNLKEEQEMRVLKREEAEKLREQIYAGEVEPPEPMEGEARERLEQAADAMNADAGAVDLENFPVDNEIAGHINELEVTNALPGYRYCWVWTGHNGYMVRAKEAMGWRVVQGSDPEAPERKESATTVRRLGDVILMKAPEAVAQKWEKLWHERERAQQETDLSNLREMGDRAGITVVTDLEHPTFKQTLRRVAARRVASQQLSGMIREGKVPGIPAPGR
jgi:hypothetical protein